MTDEVVGIIGGSGLYQIEGLEGTEWVSVDTPFGAPSDQYLVGHVDVGGGRRMRLVFLPRHGRGHRYSPTEINYRANLYGMKKLGARWIISVSAVGSLREHIVPGHMVIVDQFIDRTRHRASTFFDRGVVAHVAFADPICKELADALHAAAREIGVTVHRGGTYVVMEGPAFSTRAESHLYRSWGADVIGMTNLPEAKLAREAEIAYATVALATDFDCWHPDHDHVTVDAVIQTLLQNVANARALIRAALPKIPQEVPPYVANALQHAIMTDRAHIPADARERLSLLIHKYIS
jgi:5'-methylthioadenosine phosphorylase